MDDQKVYYLDQLPSSRPVIYLTLCELQSYIYADKLQTVIICASSASASRIGSWNVVAIHCF